MRISIQYAGDGSFTKTYHGYKAKSLLRKTLKGTEFTPEDIRNLRHGDAIMKPGQTAEAIYYRGKTWVSVYDETDNGRWDLFTIYLR